MPGGDRTGPSGRGPMTGRRLGICAGYDAPGYDNAGRGRGMNFGRRGGGGGGRGFGGGGRGFGGRGGGFGFPVDVAPQVEPIMEGESLRAQMNSLQEQLDAIMRRLDDLSEPKTS